MELRGRCFSSCGIPNVRSGLVQSLAQPKRVRSDRAVMARKYFVAIRSSGAVRDDHAGCAGSLSRFAADLDLGPDAGRSGPARNVLGGHQILNRHAD